MIERENQQQYTNTNMKYDKLYGFLSNNILLLLLLFRFDILEPNLVVKIWEGIIPRTNSRVIKVAHHLEYQPNA